MRRAYFASAGALALLVALVTAPKSAWADTIFSNFGPGDSFDTLDAYSVNSTQEVAAAFLASANFTLSQIDIALESMGGPATLDVELVNNASGFPGSTVLESWTVTNLPGFQSSYTPEALPSSGSVALSAGNYYFVVAAPAPGGGGGAWNWNNQGEMGSKYNQGSGWTGGAGATPAFDVLGTPTTATPEPAFAAQLVATLLGLSLAGLLGRKRGGA